jgi:hypothetical protein
MDEDALVDEIYENINDVLLIDKAQKPLYKDSNTILLFTSFVGQLEGIERYFKRVYDTYLNIYKIVFI